MVSDSEALPWLEAVDDEDEPRGVSAGKMLMALVMVLVGVGIGIALKFVIHAINGVSPGSFFKPFLQVTTLDEETIQIDAAGSAVFSNWLPFRRQIVQLGLVQGNDVVVNLAGTRLVDSSVMVKLEELGHDFARAGRRLPAGSIRAR